MYSHHYQTYLYKATNSRLYQKQILHDIIRSIIDENACLSTSPGESVFVERQDALNSNGSLRYVVTHPVLKPAVSDNHTRPTSPRSNSFLSFPDEHTHVD